jgi:hypothetical protein
MLELTDAEISGVLKNVYSGFRSKLFPLSTPLLANVKKGKSGGPRNMRWGGNGVIFDAVLTRPLGLTASPSGFLPPHHQATERQGTLPIKRLYVSRTIDGLAISATTSKEAAYISLAKKVLEEAKDASTLGMQEILHGDSNAIKAKITTVNSNTSIVVTDPYGITGAGQGGLLLDIDSYFAVLDASAGNAVLGRARATNVVNSGDSATITLDTPITGMAAGDLLVAATTSDTSFQSFPNGLTNIANRGGAYNDLHGITAASFPRWNAIQHTPADVDNPNELDVWDLITKVAMASGKDAKMHPGEFLLLTTPGIEKKLAESFLGQRRFDPSTAVMIKGGFKALNICGLPLVSDAFCPAGTLYLVHLPSLIWVDAKDWGMVQYESAGAWRFVSGRDAFEINWGAYLNFGCLQRNAVGLITGYTDAVRYTFVQ